MELIRILLAVAALAPRVSTLSCNVSRFDDGNSGNDVDGNYFSGAYNGSCYIFVLKTEKAKRARQYCRDIGGYLTNIDSGIQQFLEKFIIVTSQNHSEIRQDFWIGLLWSDALGLWYWDNGAKLEFKNLDEDIHGSCVVLRKSIFDWNNIGCSHEKRFICKTEPKSIEVAEKTVNDTTCADLCKDIVEDYWLRRHGVTTTTPTPGLNTSNGTTEDSTQTITDGETDTLIDEIKEPDCEIDSLTAVSLCTVLGLSLLANIVMIMVICCFLRKGKSKKADLAGHISLIDIMSADGGANNESPSEAQPVYHDPQEDANSGQEDQNNSCQAGRVSVKYSEVVAKGRTPAEGHATTKVPQHDYAFCTDNGGDTQNTTVEYSRLNPIGGNPSSSFNPGSQNLYGIESASAPFSELHKEHSSTTLEQQKAGGYSHVDRHNLVDSSQPQTFYESAEEPVNQSAGQEDAIYCNQAEGNGNCNTRDGDASTYESYTS